MKKRRPSPKIRPLSVSLARFTSALALGAALVAGAGPVGAGTYYWDSDANAGNNNLNGAGLGGTGIWNTTLFNWWDGVSADVVWPNTIADLAIFSGTAGAVTLGVPITANGLSFTTNGYALTSGTLTLAGTTPSIRVNLGDLVTIDSLIAGSDGLAINGLGGVRLTNAGNSYTGETNINAGSVIISNQGALGASPLEILINGSATRGFGGGQLVLEGAYNTSGVNISRDIRVQGLGPISDRSAALNSVHNNTLSGKITTGVLLNATAQNSAFNSASGRLTFTGELNVGGTAGTTLTTLGVVNSVGVGSYAVTDILAGSGTLQKTGAGTLILEPTVTTNFAGRLRTSAGTVRISSGAVLGTGTGATTAAVLDMNGGTLEVRSDTGDIDKNVYHRGGGGGIFADHAVGSNTLNGTATFGNLAFEENLTTTFTGRNGYSIAVGSAGVVGGDNNSNFTNNLNGGGVVSFAGNFWNNADGTSRTMTITGNADTRINGSVIAVAGGTAAHIVTKAGTGTLTIRGTGTTLDGNVNVNAGTLEITDFRSLNNNTRTIAIGSASALRVIGNNVTVANGSTNKVISITATAGNAFILADQTGSSAGLVFNSLTATGTGNRTLVLGGANAENNTIQGAIPIPPSGTLSLTKIDSGTWVLAGANGYTGVTTISDGILKIKDTFSGSSRNVLAGAVSFASNPFEQSAGGTLEYLGDGGNSSTETVGQLIPTAGAGTVRVTSGAGGTAALTFASLGARTIGATLDFRPDATGTVTFTTPTTSNDGIIGGFATFNGVDWVNSGAAATQFTTYTPGLPTSGSLATGNYLSNSDVTTTAAQTVNSLKIAGTQTITLGGILSLDTAGVLFDNSTGAATITGSQIGASNSEVIFIVNGSDPGNALTVESLISGTTGQFTKAGNGTLVVSGANVLQGNIHINAGIVRMSGATAQLGAGQVAATVLNLRQGSFLDLNGAGAPVALYPGGTPVAAIQTGTLVGSGIITNSGAGGTTPSAIIIGNGTTTTASGLFSGLIQDGGARMNVVKAGTGTQTITGANTYTGATVINSGTLAVTILGNIGVPSGIGAGFASSNAESLVFNGGTLLYTGANATVFQGTATPSVSTNRLFTLAGNATIDSQGSFGHTAFVRAPNNAALDFNNPAAVVFTGTGARTLTLQGDSNGDNRINLRLLNNPNAGEALTVSKSGAGVWILGNAANSYTGLTTVNAGQLSATSGTTLPAASPIVLNGGQLLTSGNFIRNLVPAVTAGNLDEVTWTAGGGFAASESGKLIVAMGGLATPTALTWGSGGFLGTGTGALILNSATALNEVEFRNPIDLAGGSRSIQVDDNGNTNTDFATITGVISGTGTASRVSKTGGGVLQLFGANTYDGTTAVTAGQLVVNSLGNTASPGATNLGNSANANTDGSALTLGNGGTGAGILQYVGPGETSNRKIRLNTTTGSTQIHADGSGPLILTNVANDVATGTGAKTLFLRGSNTQANTITSNLTNNGGTLGITVDGGATWVLSGANTLTGTVTVSAGALGIGSNDAIGGGTLDLSNGSTFAYGTDRTIAGPVRLVNNTTTAFFGDHSLNFTNTLQLLAAANNVTMTNNIVAGKTLSFAGATGNVVSNFRTWVINGSGDTFVNGGITSTATGTNGLAVTYSGTGTLTLSGAGDYNGNTTIQNGRVILAGGGDNRIPVDSRLIMGVAANPGTLQLGNAAGPSNQTFTALAVGTANAANAIVGGNAAVSILTLSPAVNGTFDIPIGGTGTNENNIKLVKTGAGALTINAVTTYSGGTQVGTPNGPDGGKLIVSFSGSLGSQSTPGPLTVYGGTLEVSGTSQAVGSLALGGGAPGSQSVVTADVDLEINGNITYDATNNPDPAQIGGTGSITLGAPVATTATVGKSAAGSGSVQRAPDLNMTTPFIANAVIGSDLIKEGLGTMRISGSGSGFDGDVFVNSGTLILDNQPSANVFPSTTSVTVGTTLGGAKLDLGTISGDRTDLETLTLNVGARLGFSLGTPDVMGVGGSYDNLVVNTLLTPGSVAGAKSLAVEIDAISGFGAGTYGLLTVSSPSLLDTSNPFLLGEVPGGFTYDLNVNTSLGTVLELVVNALPTDFLWKGGQGTADWSTGRSSSTTLPGATNWVDVTSAVMPNGPGVFTNVFFSAGGAFNPFTTTVDVDTSVKTLQINDVNVSSIAGRGTAGSNGTRLTIAGDTGTGIGLKLFPLAGNVTLGSNTAGLELGIGISNSQKWVNDGTGSLTVLNQVFSAALSGTQTLTFSGAGNTTISGPITNGFIGGAIAVAKDSPSIVTLTSATNDYTGPTTVTAGTLAVSGRLSGTSSVDVASGATFQLEGSGDRVGNAVPVKMGTASVPTPARFVMNGVSEQLGTFDLVGATVIDFGAFNAGAALRLAASGNVVWDTSSTLSIFNWTGIPGFGGGSDQLFFGTNALDQSLNDSQLATIQFFSDNGVTRYLFNGAPAQAISTSDGEVVPVPEPGSLVSLLGGAGLLLGLRRRRR